MCREGNWFCGTHDPQKTVAREAERERKYREAQAVRDLDYSIEDKRLEVAKLAKKFVRVRSFGREFAALAKAVGELNALESRRS